MKIQKQIHELLNHATDLTYKDIDSLLCRLGYVLVKCKGTSMAYQKGAKKISFHVPHRYDTFQAYQVTKLIKDIGDDIYDYL